VVQVVVLLLVSEGLTVGVAGGAAAVVMVAAVIAVVVVTVTRRCTRVLLGIVCCLHTCKHP
jgi:hypothetical protein